VLHMACPMPLVINVGEVLRRAKRSAGHWDHRLAPAPAHATRLLLVPRFCLPKMPSSRMSFAQETPCGQCLSRFRKILSAGRSAHVARSLRAFFGAGLTWCVWAWTAPPKWFHELGQRLDIINAVAQPALIVMLVSGVLCILVGAPPAANHWLRAKLMKWCPPFQPASS
jgi:hypothetical protein